MSGITKVAVVGMDNVAEENIFHKNVIDSLNSLTNVEVISIVQTVDNMREYVQDSVELIDVCHDMTVDIIDKADALLIITPQELNEYDLHVKMCYREWTSFLAGYTWSQGKPSILYTSEDNGFISTLMVRAYHAVLTSPDDLVNYDWTNLPVNWRSPKRLLSII